MTIYNPPLSSIKKVVCFIVFRKDVQKNYQACYSGVNHPNLPQKIVTHGQKAMIHTIFLRPLKGGLNVETSQRGVECCHSPIINFIITVHWMVGKISDLVVALP